MFQLEERFERLQTVSNNFNFLLPRHIIELNEVNMVRSCYDVTSRQVLTLKEFIKNTKTIMIKELCIYLIKNNLSYLYSEVVTSCIVVASAERSVSKLKLIKNLLKKLISRDRLTNVSILNIEIAQTEKLDIGKIILDFSNQKSRYTFFK